MSGERFLLDTNAIVALLQGRPSLVQMLAKATWIGISVISQLEFLAFRNLSAADQSYFSDFLKEIEVVGLSDQHPDLLELIVQIRAQTHLKLPDAIIAGTAQHADAVLVTADAHLHNVPGINIAVFD